MFMKKDIFICIILLFVIGGLVFGITFIYKTDFSNFRQQKVETKEDSNEDISSDEKIDDNQEKVEEIKSESNKDNSKENTKENNKENNKETTKETNKNNDKENNKVTSNTKKDDSSNNKTVSDNINNVVENSTEEEKEEVKVEPIRRLKYMTCSLTVVSNVFDGTQTVVSTFDDDYFIKSLKIYYAFDFKTANLPGINLDAFVVELQEEFTNDLGVIGKSSAITSKLDNTKLSLVYDTDIENLKQIAATDFNKDGLFYFDNFYNSYNSEGYLCD